MEKSISAFGMMRQLFAESKPFMKLLLLIIFMGVSAIIFSFAGILTGMLIYSLGFKELQEIVDGSFQGADSSIIRYLQGIQTVGFFLIPAVMANYLILSERQSFISFGKRGNSLILALLVLLTVIAAMPMIQWFIHLNELLDFPDALQGLEDKLMGMEEERKALSDTMMTEFSIKALMANLLVIAVLPAFGEEFLFRGVVQGLLHEWTRRIHLSVFLTGILFSAIHLQFYGFIPRLMLGVYFGYLVVWSGSIWPAVLAHFLNNALAVLFLFFTENGSVALPGWFEGIPLPVFGILSVILVSLLLIFSRKVAKKRVINSV